MVNYYRQSIPQAAAIQRPLNDFQKGDPKKNFILEWSEEQTNAFEELKKSLVESTLLAHPNSNSFLCLIVDASNFAIGGAVHQLQNDCLQPLAFFSKKLSSSQLKYSTYDRELLAIYESTKYFRYMLEGTQFSIYTDHKPIV